MDPRLIIQTPRMPTRPRRASANEPRKNKLVIPSVTRPFTLCYRTKSSYFLDALDTLDTLSPLQKAVLIERYVRLLESYEHRCQRLTLIFETARVLITVGSLVVPALLSIQYANTGTSSSSYSDSNTFSYSIYWTTWVLSLLVTTSNGIITGFKLDKKYYFIHTVYEQLRSEGWQYLGLTGRYSSLQGRPDEVSTHENQFIYFCHINIICFLFKYFYLLILTVSFYLYFI
jgi:hypothetical protein